MTSVEPLTRTRAGADSGPLSATDNPGNGVLAGRGLVAGVYPMYRRHWGRRRDVRGHAPRPPTTAEPVRRALYAGVLCVD